VAVVDRNEDGTRETVSRIEAAGGHAAAYAADVASSAAVTTLAAAVNRDLGPVAVLANVAGIGDTAGLEGITAIDDARWNTVLAVNLKRALLPLPGAHPGNGRARKRRDRQRVSTPEEQAAAIAFLASDDASYINGVALDTNGGLFRRDGGGRLSSRTVAARLLESFAPGASLPKPLAPGWGLAPGASLTNTTDASTSTPRACSSCYRRRRPRIRRRRRPRSDV